MPTSGKAQTAAPTGWAAASGRSGKGRRVRKARASRVSAIQPSTGAAGGSTVRGSGGVGDVSGIGANRRRGNFIANYKRLAGKTPVPSPGGDDSTRSLAPNPY